MANEKNLIPNSERTPSELREITKKGGIKSGEVRRQKKTLSELAKMIAENPAPTAAKKKLTKMGISDEDANNNACIVAAVYNKAIKGNMQAVDKWEQLVAVSKSDESKYELPARVLGKAFVDINRQIKPNIEYVFEGGRGGLKSSFVAFKIVELIKNNPQMHACITRQVAGTLKDSVYANMKWAINELGLMEEFECKVSPLEIKYIKTGQTIYFRGLDDETKLKSIKPEFGYIGILWKEEKDQMKGDAQERSVNQSVLRGGDESYDFSSYNPPKSKSNWVNRIKLMPNPKRVIHHSSYLEAPAEWLGQKFIDDAAHLKEINPEAYEHEYLGVPNGDGGNVFEYLEMNGKISGSKRQKLQLWRKRDIQKRCEHQAHRKGMRISRICAWNTSRLAYDGSGIVLRDWRNHSLCAFQTGKRYNCDLSASYNIGARYFIRELLKPLPATERSLLEAKVPAVKRRTSCVYADLRELSSEMGLLMAA